MTDKTDRTMPNCWVVGCARSGTTLWQRILDAHPKFAVANDSHFIPPAVEKVDMNAKMQLTPDPVEFVKSYRRFHRLDISLEPVDLAAAGQRIYAAFVADLYTEFARSKGKMFDGDKTPAYVKKIPLLSELFPGANSWQTWWKTKLKQKLASMGYGIDPSSAVEMTYSN